MIKKLQGESTDDTNQLLYLENDPYQSMTVEDLHNSRNVVEEDIQAIPRSVYLNSSFEHQNLGKMRDMLRKNAFYHPSYKASVQSKLGKKYYRGIMPQIQPQGTVSRTKKSSSSTDHLVIKRADIPLEYEDSHNVLELMVPQHIKYKNFSFKDVADRMKRKKL